MAEIRFSDQEIERRVMERLRPSAFRAHERRVCGFYHPDDQRVIQRLARDGRLVCWAGEGRDHGVLLAQLLAQLPAPATPPVNLQDGGAA